MLNSSSTRSQRSGLSTSRTLNDSVLEVPGVSDPNLGLAEIERENKEKAVLGNRTLNVPSPSSSATLASKNERIVVLAIQATDVSRGLGRIPASFYAVIHHSGLEWRTERKALSVNNDIVEWVATIPVPNDPFATISLTIYAPFEFQPVLGSGERLRSLTTTVEELLDHSAKALPFVFPNSADLASPCPSLLVTTQQTNCESGSSFTPTVLEPHCLTAEHQCQLEDVANHGHDHLSRFQKHGEKVELERAIEQFELVLNVCPVDHPCRAAALSNLAMSKYMLSQVDSRGPSLDVPLTLYHDALTARPVGHPDRPSTLIQLAAVYFARFKKRQDEVDASEAKALLYEAIDLSSSESHESRAAISMLQAHGDATSPAYVAGQSPEGQNSTSSLTNVDPWCSGFRSLSRFERSGDQSDLQQAISILETCIRSISVQQHPYLAGQTRLGVALLYRFHRLGELNDLEHAILRFKDAVNLMSDSHPDKADHLYNLGDSFRVRFKHLGELSDLQQAILRYKDAINLTPSGHADKAHRLSALGSSFFVRFRRLGDQSDLEEAISKLENALELIPNGHPDKPNHLWNLSNYFLARSRYAPSQSHDLDKSITMLGNAIQLTPQSHPDKPARLYNLSIPLLRRFQRNGELSDLNEAISRLGDATDLMSHDHPEKPTYLNLLGDSFFTRFNLIGDQSDLDDAISRQETAFTLAPDGHPGRLDCLVDLGRSYLARFQHLQIGGLSDLEKAISRFGNVICLLPDDDPDKPRYLTDLGHSFRMRFECVGKLSDLEQAFAKYKRAVDLSPLDHSDKPAYLSNLGNIFYTRFEHLGVLSDLEEAVSYQRSAIASTLLGDPGMPCRLKNLGDSLRSRFKHIGEFSDLEEAISRLTEAVNLVPDGHQDKSTHLNSLGISLFTRFSCLGERRDLEDAILQQGLAVDLMPPDHPHKPDCLINLGNSLRTRFEHLGELGDLETAISRQMDAMGLAPHSHHTPFYLSNLGSSFRTRFDLLGEPCDIDEAISRLQDAVDLAPHGHSEKPGCLNNLGISFLTRFRRFKKLRDLEQAISRLKDAVDLTSQGHPSGPTCLNNLGNSFAARFNQLGELSDLEQAISSLKRAVDLTPSGHPDKPARLFNLGNFLHTRFRQLGELRDLKAAVSRLCDAVDLTPLDHPDKFDYMSSLGSSFATHFRDLGELTALERAISLYSQVACASTATIAVRIRASQGWILCARILKHHSLLDAYSVAVSLVPQLAWIGLSLTQRYYELMRGADVVREAAAAALSLGHPETAVEWLEQGRSIVWGEMFQLRSSYDELSSAHPVHARKLQELSSALEQASSSRENSSLLVEPQSGEHHIESPQQVAARHRALAMERDKLLREIRGLPGFERFLLHKEFSCLRASARSGPAVILNAAKSRCDALIVLLDVENVIHVPLPDFTFKRSKGLQDMLRGLLGASRIVPCDEREGQLRSVAQRQVSWESLLSTLWNGVVKPVLDVLGFSTPGHLSRIFWCPTGPFTFLPLHAAGLYGTQSSEPGHKVSDFVVSSYLPTLSILSFPRKLDAGARDRLRLLAVRQPATDGQSRLPGVDLELEHIATVVRDSPSARVTLLEPPAGTVEQVLALMQDADWVHFACHGIQDASRPTESGLCLADGRRLRVSDMMSSLRGHSDGGRGLAFLSACQTATGDQELSDEAIHIAAGMLFAGYSGVVGTMWSISDWVAPSVARDVYGQLFLDDNDDGVGPDYREAARALHGAIGRLREGGASFVEWLPFIHVGL